MRKAGGGVGADWGIVVFYAVGKGGMGWGGVGWRGVVWGAFWRGGEGRRWTRASALRVLCCGHQ